MRVEGSRKVGNEQWPNRAKHKRAMRRYLFKATQEYRRAIVQRYGSRGAASPVRHLVKEGKPVEGG
jgi:hypothetical protein